MGTWRSNINFIKSTDPVDDKTINKPLQQLYDRSQYLKDRLDAAAVGEGLIISSQPLSSSVKVGDAVYYDDSKDIFDQALAELDLENDIPRTGKRSFVVGIVIRKLAEDMGDILIRGYYPNFQLTDSANNSLPPGNYYLSSTEPGKLTNTRPPVGVFVASVLNSGILVNPTPREVLEDHIHYRIDLETFPAAVPICEGGGRTSLIHANNDLLGWLPADDPIFQGLAPPGAFFGYNWTRDPKLAAIWPPEPLGSAYLELNGVGVPPEHVLIDSNGIWWLTDCDPYLPWDASLCASSSTTIPMHSSSAAVEHCGPGARRLTLWFTKLTSKTDQSVVTGLKPSDGSPILVNSCDKSDAEGFCTGKLELDLNIPWSKTQNTPGSVVVKDITGNGELSVGPVVEGIVGSGLISVSGTKVLNEGHQSGLVTIQGLDPTQIRRRIDVGLVALNGALENIYQGILPYVGLPADRQTSFIGKLQLPLLGFISPVLDLTFWFAVLSTGTPPTSVKLRHAIINEPSLILDGQLSSSATNITTLPTAWSNWLDLDLNEAGPLPVGGYFGKVALNLAVTSGQLLLFELQRDAPDGFPGELAVINMFGEVYE